MDSSVEVDRIDEPTWSDLSSTFADANIYQTWPYEAVKSGEANLSHLVLKHGSHVVAAVQARVLRIPYLRSGVAYVLWGPLSRSKDNDIHLPVFRQAVRALRAEYVERRGFCVRIVPRVSGDANGSVHAILEEEGYAFRPNARPQATILMDLRPDLDELYRGLHHKWRYHLNKARKQKLKLIEGENEQFLVNFERIYGEMVDGKKFINFVDIRQLKKIQQRLPSTQKMRVFLLSVEGEVCCGGICSDLGDTAVYLFGATSNRGIKTYGSYLVHWSMLAWAKARGCRRYDLNGIDPVRNAGGYQFKSQLAAAYGREVSFAGQYDAYPSTSMKALVSVGYSLRRQLRRSRQTLARLS